GYCPGRQRTLDRQALPSGCRVDVWNVQRPVRVGSELRALLPGRHDDEAARVVWIRAQPMADHQVRGVPVDREVRRGSFRSAIVAAADADDGIYGTARR